MHFLPFRQRQGVPLAVAGFNMVPRGLEPRTLRLLAVRSNQLSYETLDGSVKQASLNFWVFLPLKNLLWLPGIFAFFSP